MSKHSDMNGIWSGKYDYDKADQTVKFVAWFDDTNGVLRGSAVEPNTFGPIEHDELTADLTGSRDGTAISFAKIYTPDTDVVQPPVHYSGDANHDFTQVRGVWRFARNKDWTGQFALIRLAGGINEAVARKMFAMAGLE